MKRLTPTMKRRLVPYLPKLIRYWRNVVRVGEEARTGCPLCTAALYARDAAGSHEDETCKCCPIWGLVAKRGTWDLPCVEYMPNGAVFGGEAAQRVLDFLLDLQKKAKEGKV